MRKQLTIAVALPVIASLTFANEPVKTTGSTKVVVTALKENKTIDEAAASIEQISSQTIERQISTDLKDVLAYEPGVSIDTSARGGLSNIRIRGIGDDRVMILVDGAPIPSTYSFGAYMSAGQEYFDVDAMKQIEIIKGPVSTLYGSSALAGSVVMVTRDPEDYIEEGRRFGGEAKLGYKGDVRGTHASGAFAIKLTDKLSTLVRFGISRDNEKENYYGSSSGEDNQLYGNQRKHPDAIDKHMNSWMNRWVFEPNDKHRFSLSYEYFREVNQINNLSRMNYDVTSTHRQLDVRGRDRMQREQWLFKHEFAADRFPLFDSGHWQVYWQKSKTQQNTYEYRYQTRSKYMMSRSRESSFNNKQLGFDVQFAKFLEFGGMTHEIMYGAMFSEQKVRTMRHGETYNLKTGKSIEAEAFPNQGFPDSKVTKYGFFLQDRIGFFDHKLELIPGIRYDHYKLSPKKGGAYASANPTIDDPTEIDQGQVSKRLGVIFHPFDAHTLYFNYSEGFRAPTFSAVNIGFSNQAMNYVGKPNPDLRAETSKNYELGWNYNGEALHTSLVGFYTTYKDFIEELSYTGKKDSDGRGIYQSRNLGKARIYGVEAKGSLSLSTLFNWRDEIKLDASIAYAKGKDRESDEPINSVDPLNGTLGLSYERGEQLYVALKWRLFKAKSMKDITSTLREDGHTGNPGYGKLDLIAEYKLNKDVQINAGIYNLTNKKYWDWGTRMNTVHTDSLLARQSQPGINAAISIKIKF